jgi:hypothetical protein
MFKLPPKVIGQYLTVEWDKSPFEKAKNKIMEVAEPAIYKSHNHPYDWPAQRIQKLNNVRENI